MPGHHELSDASATSDEDDGKEDGKRALAAPKSAHPRARCSRGRGRRTMHGGRAGVSKAKPEASSQEGSHHDNNDGDDDDDDDDDDGDDNGDPEIQFKNSPKVKPGKGKTAGRKIQRPKGRRQKVAVKGKKRKAEEEWSKDKSGEEEDAEKKGNVADESDDSDDDIPLGILIPGRKVISQSLSCSDS